MKSFLIVLSWIFLIVLIVLIFPKTCGSKYLDQVINSNIEYKCLGFPGPNLSEKYNWCYGICLEKSQENKKVENEEPILQIPIIASFIKPFKKALKPIAIILLIIGAILALQRFSKVGKNNMVVYNNQLR